MRWKKMQYEMPVETELEEYVRREGTPEDWSKMKQIKKGENLESFLTDKNWVIRGLLVEKGYFLDILVNDSDLFMTIMSGYCLLLLNKGMVSIFLFITIILVSEQMLLNIVKIVNI